MREKDFLPDNFDTQLFHKYEKVAEDFLTATVYRDIDEKSRETLYRKMELETKWNQAFRQYNNHSDGKLLNPEEWVVYIEEQVGDLEQVATRTDQDWITTENGDAVVPEPSIAGDNVSLRAFVEGRQRSGFTYHGPLFSDELDGETEFKPEEEPVDIDELDRKTEDLEYGFTEFVKEELGRLPHDSRELVNELYREYSSKHSYDNLLTVKEFVEQLHEMFEIELDYDPQKDYKTRRSVASPLKTREIVPRRWSLD